MRKNNKKGFTIAELVIVIAVIAILAAVLIPVFGNVTENARRSGDTQIIRELNLALDSENSGNAPATMYDANAITKEYGFDVGRIVAKSKLSIAWNNSAKRFVLLDEAKQKYLLPVDEFDVQEKLIKDEDKLNFFVVRKSLSEANGYSVYAGPQWTENTVNGLSVGFDAGDQFITSVSFVRSQTAGSHEVIIRTNGGKLIIDDASLGSINHYGEAESINIIQCHTASYHEYGTVSFVNIKKGHVAFEKGSAVNGIHLEKSGSEVVGDKTYDTFDTVILSFDETVEQPEYSRDAVSINPEGTKVCTLDLPDETTNIYLFLDGIYEQIKIETANVSGEGTSEKEWVSTSSATIDTKTAADQLANNFDGRETAIGNELSSEVINNESREFVESSSAEKVAETGINKDTAGVLVMGIKAYVDVLTDVIEVDLLDFTAKAEELGQSTDGKLDLNNLPTPNHAILKNAYSFRAFETEADEQAITELFAYMGITDDRQLKDITVEDVENAIQSISATTVDKERLLALVKVRKDYLTWRADFTVSFDHDVKANSIALSGQYDNYSEAWLGLGLPINLSAGQEIRLMQTAYQATNNNPVFAMNYISICGWVKEFNCGIANLAEENVGTKATITLKIYEVDENGEETGKEIEISTISILFTEYQMISE